MRTPPLLIAAFALSSGFAMGACRVSRPNPEHCFYARGDETCVELDPARPFCVTPTCSSEPYGCTAEQPTDATCHSPCGGASTSEDDSSCTELADDSESDEAPPDMADTTNYDCESHADCPPEAGFCYFGLCTPCDGTSDPDSACHVLTEGQAPVCLDGDCVQCTEDDVGECIEASLACDVSTHTCIPCTAHDQCPGGAACDLPIGTCLPADAVWHVDGDGGQDFTTLSAAMAALNGGSGTLIVHELDNGDGYNEGIVISGDRSVALFGAEGELPSLFLLGEVSVEVSNGARVHARRLALAGESPVRVTENGYIDLDSCALAAFSGDTLLIHNSELHMRNSMLLSEDDWVTLRLLGDAHVHVAYSTLVAFGPDPVVSCTISPAIGSSVRNSVLLNMAPSSALDCMGLPYSNNVVDDPRPNNTSVGDLETGWFILDEFLGDVHLSDFAPVAFSSAAVWELGDPTVDFDGDPRPTRDQSTDFAGADRLP